MIQQRKWKNNECSNFETIYNQCYQYDQTRITDKIFLHIFVKACKKNGFTATMGELVVFLSSSKQGMKEKRSWEKSTGAEELRDAGASKGDAYYRS